MYDIYAYFDFDIGYFAIATKIVDSRYLTSVLAAAYGSFGLSDGGDAVLRLSSCWGVPTAHVNGSSQLLWQDPPGSRDSGHQRSS